MIMIVLILGIGYWLYSTGKLEEIMGQFNLGGGGAVAPPVDAEPVPEEASAEAGPGEESADVSGENAGASVNGKCLGDPEQCRKAEELLEMIQK